PVHGEPGPRGHEAAEACAPLIGVAVACARRVAPGDRVGAFLIRRRLVAQDTVVERRRRRARATAREPKRLHLGLRQRVDVLVDPAVAMELVAVERPAGRAELGPVAPQPVVEPLEVDLLNPLAEPDWVVEPRALDHLVAR